MSKYIGAVCRIDRNRHGLSIEELSKRSGVCTDQIKFFEEGDPDDPTELMWPGTAMRLEGYFDDAELERDMRKARAAPR